MQQILASTQTQNTRLKLDWDWDTNTFIFTALIIFKPFIFFLRNNLTKKFWNTKRVTGQRLLFQLKLINFSFV